MEQLNLFEEVEVIDTTALDLAIEDALFRIKRDYQRTNGQIYLSFSGGKDSTVLAHLIMMANLPTPIPFVFSNTGVELGATLEFVKTFDYDHIQILKPKMSFPETIKKYGKPCLSKLKSEALSTYQKNIDSPYSKARAFQLITGTRIKEKKLKGSGTNYRLANKYLHFLHPDTEFKVGSKCCDILKKYPFEEFEKEHQMKGAFSGVRVAEGGVRSMAYTSCVTVKKKKDKKKKVVEEFIASMPIIDWTDDLMEQFISRYDILLSRAYTEYGLKRTGWTYSSPLYW